MATLAPSDTPGQEALEQFLPYVLSGFSAFSSAMSTTSRLLSPLFSKFSPIPIFFYFMAPLFVFIEMTIEVFIHVPYRIAASLLDAFYPIYVFCGVACITGTIIGITARLISKLVVYLLAESPGETERGLMVELGESKKLGKRKGKA